MKKQGKIYVGVLLSLVMALMVSVSVLAAEDGSEDQTDEENIVQTIDADSTDPDELSGEEEDSDLDSDFGDEDPTPVESITIAPSTLALQVKGQTAQLTVTFDSGEAANTEVIWSSSNTSVATVNDQGLVTAVGNGSAAIMAVYTENTELSDECTVTVSFYSDGFHQDPDSNDWYYYKNGAVDTSKTDVMQGTVNGKSGWWNVIKGKVTRSETVAQNSNGWWYINSNGMVDFSYKGFAKNSYGWWYIEGGKVVFSTNSVIQDTGKKIDSSSGWWYVLGGQVQTGFTGLADYSNAYGWWYVNNGKVTFNVNTVAENKYGWWYVKDSKVSFSYKGFAKNNYGWWYIDGGKVIFSKNSVIQDTGKKVDGTSSWWYVTGGQVQTGFTGLANYANDYGWWYIKNGKVDFSYKGFAKNNYGWWYLEGGKVIFSKNTVMQGTVNGTNTWWYVTGGKVQTGFTGLANYANANGWWYIRNGKVDFSVTTIATNNYGTWYVKDGKVDFNYTGSVTVDGVKYNVTKGQVGVSVSSKMYNNAQPKSSSTKWLIVVDTSACKVGIFSGSKGNWVAQKYWDCSPGKPSTPTKKGTFTVGNKGKSFGSSTYTCWYYTQFYGGYLFHSVLYKPGSMTQFNDGRLGMQLSHGCVRLALENAKWIYDNIPKGSTVYVY